jgi:uncharacterized repeat protein (TIGR02543 family)
MSKNAYLNGSPPATLIENGKYSNPVAVLYSDTILYEIEAYDMGGGFGGVNIKDTLPLYLKYVPGSASHGGIRTPTSSYPERDILTWNSLVITPPPILVTYKATPVDSVCYSQPLFLNRAWIYSDDPDDEGVDTYPTYHQGAGASILTFSAGFGGRIYHATEQILDYRTTPRPGILVVPDEGYRFAGWSHAAYQPLRGETIPAQSGIMLYDTLTVYGNMELRAGFALEAYALSYHLHDGVNAPDNPQAYTILSGDITLGVPVKVGDVFTGWTGSNGDEPQLVVTIPHGSTGERAYYANYLYSGRQEVGNRSFVEDVDKIWAAKGDLFVRTTKPGTILRIYSIDGILIRQHTLLQPDITKYKLPSGLYVVTLNNGVGQKMIIDSD